MTNDECIEHLIEAYQYLEGRVWATEVLLRASFKGTSPLTEESAKDIIQKEWPGLSVAGEVAEPYNRGIDQAIGHVLHGSVPRPTPGKIGFV